MAVYDRKQLGYLNLRRRFSIVLLYNYVAKVRQWITL